MPISNQVWSACHRAATSEEGWEGWPESTPGRQSPGVRPVYSGRSHEILFEAPTEGDLLLVVTLDDASPTDAPRKLQMSVNGRPAELKAVRRLPDCCFAPIRRNASEGAMLRIEISAPGNEASAAVAIISSVSVMPLHSGRFSKRWTSPLRAIKTLLSRRTPSEWDEADFPYSHFDGLNYLLCHHEARTAVLSRKFTSAYHYYQAEGRHRGQMFPFAINHHPPLPGTPFNLVEYYRERQAEAPGAHPGPDHAPELNPCPYHPYDQLPFAGMAMKKLVEDYQFESVLDIGSGEGAHSRLLEKLGKQVTSIDFGRSIYYTRTSEHRTTITGDYLSYDFGQAFDAIWASHVLEHQPNVNFFLRKIYQDLKDGGVLAITVPPLKHEIVGGHLTLWNAGLLLYNLVMAGFDCREASILKYGYNISVIVRKRPIADHPQLAYDAGDVDLLRAYLPQGLNERFHGDISTLNWSYSIERFRSSPEYDRTSLIEFSVETAQKVSGHFLEFGVFRGESIRRIASLVPSRRVYGFDSFRGLPEDWHRGNSVYKRGHFDLHGELPDVPDNVELVQGFFDETLPRWLERHEGDIAFLHIDSDLYSSCALILSLLNARIKENTIILFDELCDWQHSDVYSAWSQHEWKALQEWLLACKRSVQPIARGKCFESCVQVLH